VNGDQVIGYDPPPDRPSDFAVPTGFRFVDPSGELVGALDRAIANRLFRKRA